MTREEREIALYCLKASSDYHLEVCEECAKYPNCDHTIQDDITETIIKELEQEPCEDVMAIHTQGLDEGIRCAMCTNSMKSDRGCDGGCVVNEYMYREVMNTIENHIVPPVTPTQEPILDKIRAEIQAIETGGDCWELAIKEECLNIIDKYKVESEVK